MLFVDYGVSKECKNTKAWFMCHKCGKCGREFDDLGFLLNGDKFPAADDECDDEEEDDEGVEWSD